MDQTVIFLIAGIALLVVAAVFVYASKTNDKFADMIPMELVKLIAGQGDRLLQVSLTLAANTPSELDDQAIITLLELRGWNVTGDSSSGYVVTKELADETSG